MNSGLFLLSDSGKEADSAEGHSPKLSDSHLGLVETDRSSDGRQSFTRGQVRRSLLSVDRGLAVAPISGFIYLRCEKGGGSVSRRPARPPPLVLSVRSFCWKVGGDNGITAASRGEKMRSALAAQRVMEEKCLFCLDCQCHGDSCASTELQLALLVICLRKCARVL